MQNYLGTERNKLKHNESSTWTHLSVKWFLDKLPMVENFVIVANTI